MAVCRNAGLYDRRLLTELRRSKLEARRLTNRRVAVPAVAKEFSRPPGESDRIVGIVNHDDLQVRIISAPAFERLRF